MVSKKTLQTLLVGAVAVSAGMAANSAHAMDAGKEKCYGVVKAGHNDCGNAAKTHSCAGHAATDADGGEWLALPKGTCEKLVGGSTSPIEAASLTDTATEAVHDAADHMHDKATDMMKK